MGARRPGAVGTGRAGPVRGTGLRQHDGGPDRRAGSPDQEQLLPALPGQAGGALLRPGRVSSGCRPTPSSPPPATPRRWRRSPPPSTLWAPCSTPDRHPFASRRQAVIAANSELQEREALKRAGLASAMTEALRQRGVSEPAASLAAELGLLAFRTAFARWPTRPTGRSTASWPAKSLAQLQAANASLSSAPPDSIAAMARGTPLVPLGYGKFVRADRVYALVPLEGEDRGDGRRTLVSRGGDRGAGDRFTLGERARQGHRASPWASSPRVAARSSRMGGQEPLF